MTTAAKDQRLVVAVISTALRAGRAELRGIDKAAAGIAGWTLERVDPAQTGPDMAPFAPLFARADGVIVRDAPHLESLAPLLPDETPVVQIDARHARADARVKSDVAAETDLAVRELLSFHRRSYAFVPMPKAQRWTAKRAAVFLAKMRAAGANAFVYEPKTEWGWSEERDALAKWLAALPRPLAVFVSTDFLGKFTMDACRDAGLRVPDDAAILGSGDDETIVFSTTPTLSSIRVDSEGAGRLSVEMLARLFEGAAARRDSGPPRHGGPDIPVALYGPLDIVRRGSTRRDEPGTDPRMAAGLDFIAAHSYNPLLGVRDVAAAMGTGRRQAERLFRSTGKSIRQCVEEARMEHVCLLLKTTSMPLRAIAEECGFSSRPYLSRVFKKRFGKTPGEWRCQIPT